MNNGNSNGGENSSGEEKPIGLFRSIYLYAMLFLYYPIKYTFLLTLLMAAYKLWMQVLHFGEKSWKNISKAFCILVECASLRDDCQMNLILFLKFLMYFIYLRVILKFILGIIFLFVAVCFFIATMFSILPFNLLLPTYTATFYN